jgi:hypothetical protein
LIVIEQTANEVAALQLLWEPIHRRMPHADGANDALPRNVQAV